MIIVFIVVYVTSLLIYFLRNQVVVSPGAPANELEFAWTVYPAVVLIGIALPSLRILYLLDDVGVPKLTIKVIGHQWYWSYSVNEIIFDSYIINVTDLLPGYPRLLEVDNRLVLPTNIDLRFLISSADVLHSWAIPSLGVKVDAVPGRLNQFSFSVLKPGVFYGQCSEICGANHRFMPIALEAIGMMDWVHWTQSI